MSSGPLWAVTHGHSNSTTSGWSSKAAVATLRKSCALGGAVWQACLLHEPHLVHHSLGSTLLRGASHEVGQEAEESFGRHNETMLEELICDRESTKLCIRPAKLST